MCFPSSPPTSAYLPHRGMADSGHFSQGSMLCSYNNIMISFLHPCTHTHTSAHTYRHTHTQPHTQNPSAPNPLPSEPKKGAHKPGDPSNLSNQSQCGWPLGQTKSF